MARCHTYDPNGNVISTVDPRGATDTVYHGYDGLNRPLWQSTHSDGSSPLATMSYDSTAAGNQGVGRLTSETFASGPNQATTGGYAYTYDVRGRQTGWTMTNARLGKYWMGQRPHDLHPINSVASFAIGTNGRPIAAGIFAFVNGSFMPQQDERRCGSPSGSPDRR